MEKTKTMQVTEIDELKHTISSFIKNCTTKSRCEALLCKHDYIDCSKVFANPIKFCGKALWFINLYDDGKLTFQIEENNEIELCEDTAFMLERIADEIISAKYKYGYIPANRYAREWKLELLGETIAELSGNFFQRVNEIVKDHTETATIIRDASIKFEKDYYNGNSTIDYDTQLMEFGERMLKELKEERESES